MTGTNGTRIGLEVHVPLATEAKLFCTCPATPDETANTQICPTCTGQPGARPQGVNRRAVEQALRAAMVLDLELDDVATIQRKHYVYPDLPNNYQRTSTPLGHDGEFWDVGIREAHIEEDPGAFDPDAHTVDLDRSGTPLVEIVTEPDLATPEAVDAWIGVLRLALDRAGITRPEAELKADVNVSTRGGDRVEVKNVVGGKNASRAAAFEIERQHRLRDDDQPVPRETRHFDEAKHTTRASRAKETVGDYRFMPDPDLDPIDLAEAATGLEAPSDVQARLVELMDAHGLELGEAMALLSDTELEALFADLREAVSDELAVEVALRRLRGELDYRDATFSQLDAGPEPIVDLAEAWHEDEITKHVFTRLLREHLDGADIADELEEETSTDVDLEQVVETVLEEEPEAVEDYHDGSEGALNYLVGQVMAKTQGRADPKATRDALAEALDEDR